MTKAGRSICGPLEPDALTHGRWDVAFPLLAEAADKALGAFVSAASAGLARSIKGSTGPDRSSRWIGDIGNPAASPSARAVRPQ